LLYLTTIYTKCNFFFNDETNFNAKAIEINRHLSKEERRIAGPKIGAIIVDKKYNLEVVVIEVSGPPAKKRPNSLFRRDRNKIAKNLKAMHKRVASLMEVPNVILRRKIKLYGIQFYCDNVYIYSLTKPSMDYYAFTLETEFVFPNNSSLHHQSLPTFFKNIWLLNSINTEARKMLDEVFVIDSEQEVLTENVKAPSPHQSLRKKQKVSSNVVSMTSEE
jgi:hypothetical protein